MRHLIALAATALVSVLSLPAWSQDAGFYIGAELGQARHKEACEGADISCDDKDSAWKLFAGYQFNRHVAVELSYADLGESSASGVVSGITAQINAEITAWEAVAVGSFPVMDRLSLFGKAGLYRAETKVSGSASFGGFTFPVSEKESNFDLTFGVGVRFDITRNLGVRAGWQRYLDVGGEETGESDVDLLSVGVLFRF